MLKDREFLKSKADMVISKPLVPEIIERAIVNLLASLPQPYHTAAFNSIIHPAASNTLVFV